MNRYIPTRSKNKLPATQQLSQGEQPRRPVPSTLTIYPVQNKYITITGSDNAITGALGPRGAMGWTGFTGSIGWTGNTGFTGTIGTTGWTGKSGETGWTGGSSGTTGTIGNTGFTGNGFTGPIGVIGPPGENGTLMRSGSVFPASSINGEYFFNTSTQLFYEYSSGQWNEIANMSVPSFSANSTAPSSLIANSGSIFINTSSNKLYKYSSGWNPTMNIGGITLSDGANGPGYLPGKPGDYFINTTKNQVYTRGDNFNPTSISGLQNWYDATDPLGTGIQPATGTTVGTWYDKSGNGQNTLSSGGTAITMDNDGLPFLNFNNSFYIIPKMSWQSSYVGFTIFMVEQTTGSDDNVMALLGSNSSFQFSGAGPTFQTGPSINSAYYWGWRSGQGNVASPNNILLTSPYSNNPTRVWSLVTTYSGSSYFYSIYLNGALQAGPTSITNLPITSGINVIGASPCDTGAAAGAYQGKMREVIAYRGNMANTDRQGIEGYLAWKWGQQTTLPNSHMYYTQTPNPSPWSSIINIGNLITNGPNEPSGVVANGAYYINSSTGQLSQYTSTANVAVSSALNNIPGLQLWLDASDPLGNGTVPANGSTVTTWTDKSGNGYNSVGSGTPTLTANSQNSLPGITVNNTVGGASGTYYTSRIPPGTFLNSLSVFIVYKSLSSTSYNGLFARGSDVGSMGNLSRPFTIEYDKIIAGQLADNTGNAVQYSPGAPIYNPNTSVMFINMNQIKSTVTQYSNGDLKTTNVAVGSPPWTTSDIGNGVFLGTRADKLDTSNQIFYEVLLFNTNITTSQRQTVEGYLAWKWGLQSSLVAGHPYRAAGPIPSPGWNVIVGGSRIVGSFPYKNTLLSTSITNSAGGTAIYEVGPINTTVYSKLLITANLSFVAASENIIQLTVGRHTATGATANQSINVPSNTTIIRIPYTSGSAYFMAAKKTTSGQSVNLCGTAVDSPGAGTFYYRIWASSVPAMSANTTLTANLNILHM